MSKRLCSIQITKKSTAASGFVQNITRCGVFVSLGLTTFTSPSFAQQANCGLNIPFEKGAIERFAAYNSYSQKANTVGAFFENAALTSEGNNGLPFRTNTKRVNVPGVGNAVPDIFTGIVVLLKDLSGNILYQSPIYGDSFIGDTKAINPNGLVLLDTQMKVYIAALAKSPAGVAPPISFPVPNGSPVSVRPTPILFLATTAFVKPQPSLVSSATTNRVAVGQAISCQQLLLGRDTMYMSDMKTLNTEVVQPPRSGSLLTNPGFVLGAGTSVPINVHAVDITSITPASGPRGTHVTINGVNFNAGQTITVEVNGIIPRQVNRLSDTQVLFTVPSSIPVRSSGRVNVTVGKVTKLGPNFTVTP